MILLVNTLTLRIADASNINVAPPPPGYAVYTHGEDATTYAWPGGSPGTAKRLTNGTIVAA